MVMLFGQDQLPKPRSEGEFLKESGLKNLENSSVVLGEYLECAGHRQGGASSLPSAVGLFSLWKGSR